jgi:hypothetical protein
LALFVGDGEMALAPSPKGHAAGLSRQRPIRPEAAQPKHTE